ncbi:MAG: hypothetical protein IT581_08700 [Verrucomicrobiales bacterium]|nr:hypothetical protein [Verrucomicrobiales bacterium]
MTAHNHSPGELRAGLVLAACETHELRVRPVEALRIEVESALFGHASALLLPESTSEPAAENDLVARDFDSNDLWESLEASHKDFADAARTVPFEPDAGGSGARRRRSEGGHAVILFALERLESELERFLVVAGHADRSGSEAYNEALSEARARCVLSLLEGDRKAFVQSTRSYHPPAADGEVLRFAARTQGWGCDPGQAAEPTGPDIEAFQRSYNAGFGRSIAEDGVIGDETLGAFFDLFESDLAAMAGGQERLAELRGCLRYVDVGNKFLACGERFPIENPEQDGFRSRFNRRVELLMFADPDLPAMGTSDAAERIYGRKFYRFTMIDAERRPRVDGEGAAAGDEGFSMADAPAPAPGAGEPEGEFATEMVIHDAAGDPTDAYAFLDPFEDAHPGVGAQATRDNSETAIA